jgi:hypothetical protein
MLRKLCVAAAVVALGLIAFGLASPDFTVSISEEKARAEVSGRLPVETSRLGVKISIKAIDLDFRDDNKVGVGVFARAEGFGFSGQAEVNTVSGVRYDAGKFYLTDLALNDVRFTPDPPASAVIADRQMVIQGALAAVRNRLNESQADAGEAFVREQSRLLERLKPIAIAMMQDSLRSIPIYDLAGKDLKRDVAAMALKDFRFSGDAAHVVLSSRQFVNTILYYTACIGLFFGAITLFAYGHRTGAPGVGRG